MLLTVVIPTHNRADMLDQAITSVLCSPLIQTGEQVIVVDDDSNDHTRAIAERHRVSYMRVVCGTPSGARNAGLKLARSEYVAFLDDDDCWLPGNMEPQLEALLQ